MTIFDKEFYVFKILILGEESVGKTSLIQQVSDNIFVPDFPLKNLYKQN